jgi:hypothetical protein
MAHLRLGAKEGLGVLLGLGLAGIIAATAYLLVDPAPPYFPDPGAYLTPSLQGDAVSGQTLKVNLSGRIKSIKMSDLDLGADGVNPVFQITSSATGDIMVQAMTVNGIRCPRLVITGAMQTATINNNEADGNSVTLSPATISAPNWGSDRGALTLPEIKGSQFDRIIMDAGDNTVVIESWDMTNIRAFGGQCLWDGLTVGSFTLTNAIVGTGDGINTPDFVLNLDVQTGDSVENALEVAHDVR